MIEELEKILDSYKLKDPSQLKELLEICEELTWDAKINRQGVKRNLDRLVKFWDETK